ncbi:peroxidase-related enzyme [Desulfobulbus sp. AH-315-M07]|nr:peroxidase-related enzyme [Desulfobulbus sp. AH-315-M07]
MTHHRRGLRRLLKDEVLANQIAEDFEQAWLSERDKAMLRYAAKLTRAPETITKPDVDGLREHSFSDTDVLAIAEVAAYFNYVNRMVEGLGVALEDE